jgi:hypothetical protein
VAGKNTFIRLEVCKPNSLRRSLLVTEHTSPSGYTIFISISGVLIANGVQIGRRVSCNVS